MKPNKKCRCQKQITEIKHSTWMLHLLRLVLTNQSALFQSRVVKYVSMFKFQLFLLTKIGYIFTTISMACCHKRFKLTDNWVVKVKPPCMLQHKETQLRRRYCKQYLKYFIKYVFTIIFVSIERLKFTSNPENEN